MDKLTELYNKATKLWAIWVVIAGIGGFVVTKAMTVADTKTELEQMKKDVTCAKCEADRSHDRFMSILTDLGDIKAKTARIDTALCTRIE